MTKFVEPHSDEWFIALDRINPQQADHTRTIIQLSGAKNVCSVCGDSPAQDYQIENAPMQDKSFATIRLCQDCLTMRKSMHGEKLVAIAQEDMK